MPSCHRQQYKNVVLKNWVNSLFIPGVPGAFSLRASGYFGVVSASYPQPRAEATSEKPGEKKPAFRAGHNTDLTDTETGNRA